MSIRSDVKRPFRPQSWPEHEDAANTEETRGSRESKWLPSNLIYLRNAVDLFGKRYVENWLGTEIDSRPGLTAPSKPWSLRTRDGEIMPVYIYDAHGHASAVSVAQAEEWWAKFLPSFLDGWKQEVASQARWQKAVDFARDKLAQEQIIASIIAEDGRTYELEPEIWRSAKADVIFYLGFAKTAAGSFDTSYMYEGMVTIIRVQQYW